MISSTSYSAKELSATGKIGDEYEGGGPWYPYKEEIYKTGIICPYSSDRLAQYTTEEITHSIGKGPTHTGADFKEIPEAKEKWVVLM